MNNITALAGKFPHLIIVKVSNGFLVGIFPENRDMQKMMAESMKTVLGMIQNMEGDEWKSNLQKSVDNALRVSNNDNIKIYVCKDAFEVMSYIAPLPEGDLPKEGKPDTSWFWKEEGHIPYM
jgi:hypothetical protein